MPSVPVEQSLQAAIAHHMAGRIHDAEAIYRQILSVRPDHAQSLYLLGTIAAQAGRGDQALELMQRAASVDPRNPAYHNGLGILLQGQGRLDQAIASYQRALAVKADMPDVHFNLGTAWVQKDQLDTAIACFQHAVVLDPRFAQAHYNLGNAWNQKKDYSQAVGCFRKAIALQPDYADAHNNLAVAQVALGQWDQAVASYNKVISLRPDDAIAHRNLGDALRSMGQFHQAVASYQRAIALRPELPEAHTGLGLAWYDKGNIKEAIACYQQALLLDPDHVETLCNLGAACKENQELDRAIACFQRAIFLKGDLVEAHIGLGAVWNKKNDLDQAVACFQRALAINPIRTDALTHLGVAWNMMGRLDESAACYRRALEIDPRYVRAHDNLLFVLLFHPATDAESLLAESRRWNQQHAQPLHRPGQPYPNDRNPDRRLRIGYVSPDFRNHPIGRFMLPPLAWHDRNTFDVFCYSQVPAPDEVSAKLRSFGHAWRDIVRLSDAEAAALIRADRIDILVDLTMHLADNRLLVFARKPVPVQATWLAYPGTTGLDAIDYRLTDPYLDPPGLFDDCYCERSIRMADTFWCYPSLGDEPDVSPLPCLENGIITFGCMNNFCKVNDAVLSLWARVLSAVARSRLILLVPQGCARQRVLDRMNSAGIDSSRIDMVGGQLHFDYLRTFQRIDIALDTFPYNGHTTSLDSFFMGVPVITLVGKTIVGRAGLSQLTNLRLAELIAQTPEQYIQIASNLAADRPRLAELRKTLRQRMQDSPLMDGQRFTRSLEDAFRTMWRAWCRK